MNYLSDIGQRVWKMTSDIPFVATALAIGAAGTKLCGDSFWAVLFLSYGAIIVDTITKWIAVTKRYYRDHNLRLTTWTLFVNVVFHGPAWTKGYLESRATSRIIEKIFTYTVVIFLCHAGGKWLPSLDLFGLIFSPSSVFPAAASIGVFLIELKSIGENLKEMGQSDIADTLANVIGIITDKIQSKGRG